ncbi:MAG: DUF6786 family protein [Candidatus Hydrogenedentes bacterium]|nr:DUF6786 family protein [Candidatus Hydrogenedentota bacterium]
MALNLLRNFDSELVELTCGRGSVLIPPKLHGRIFCQFDGELIHRLDAAALLNPSPDQYDNFGGNSLWPAPEGGPFAFNYLPGGDAWTVQDGIGKAIPSVSCDDGITALVEKHITITNRKGFVIHLGYRRLVSVPDGNCVPQGYDLNGLSYRTEDIFEPLGDYNTEDVLLAPWSLEQFPGAEGILAFGKVGEESDALNCDFYGQPGDRIALAQGQFTFRLGGDQRQQIGVRVSSRPRLIGALDLPRSMLFLRKTQPQEGLYFNIADNDQATGPFSAADLYSIFNGGDLGFFELETVGAMRVIEGRVAVSTLPSETVILKGSTEELLRYLSEQEGVRIAESVPSYPCGAGPA